MPHATCTTRSTICRRRSPSVNPSPVAPTRPGTLPFLSTYQAVVNPARTACGDEVKTAPPGAADLGAPQLSLSGVRRFTSGVLVLVYTPTAGER
jgi:hypothetical protein